MSKTPKQGLTLTSENRNKVHVGFAVLAADIKTGLAICVAGGAYFQPAEQGHESQAPKIQ